MIQRIMVVGPFALLADAYSTSPTPSSAPYSSAAPTATTSVPASGPSVEEGRVPVDVVDGDRLRAAN